jgi:hypothetical protein
MADNPVPMRRLPYARVWSITARTVHIAATSLLTGGYAFGAPPSALTSSLLVSSATGLLLIVVEAYLHPHWVDQLWFLAVLAKLLPLCLVPFVSASRVPLLLLVIVIASAGSHAPRRIRHYSVSLGRAEY